MAKLTKKKRAAAARKAARTRAKNAGRKGSRKASRKASKKRGKTSRGMRVGSLPFIPQTYGKSLPAALKALGIKAGRVPVVSFPSQPKGGFYAVDTHGSPSARKKKHKKSIAKQVRLRSQLGKVMKALAHAAAMGKDTTALHTRLVKLQQAIVSARAFDAKVKAQMARMSPAKARAYVKAQGAKAGKEVGATAAATAAATAPAAASAGQGYGGARSSSDPGVGFEGQGYGGSAEDRKIARMMASNPEVFMRHGKRRVLLDLQPVARGTKGAVSVVVGPQAYKYATLTPKLKSNGHYSARKNMSKKKRSMRRNPLGADLAQLGKPVLGAGAGFVASRLLNALALMGASKSGVGFFATPAGQAVTRLGATGLGVIATLMYGNKVAMIRENRSAIVTGMALNALESTTRALIAAKVATGNPYLRDLALGGHSYYDVSHAGAPYSPMMGEYVAQSLNGMGEYVAQSLNGGMGAYVAEAAAGMGHMGEYVAQSLNGEGVDPSDQEGVDDMINSAEAYAGLGTQVMAATAGMGTEVMAATAGLYGFGDAQGMDRGIVTKKGIYNFFTHPTSPGRQQLPMVSTQDAPMPVTSMGFARPGAVPINENLATPEGRGYAGGIFGRHVFGTMVG